MRQNQNNLELRLTISIENLASPKPLHDKVVSILKPTQLRDTIILTIIVTIIINISSVVNLRKPRPIMFCLNATLSVLKTIQDLKLRRNI